MPKLEIILREPDQIVNDKLPNLPSFQRIRSKRGDGSPLI